MFGKNPLRMLEKGNDKVLQVQGKPWLTLQGEGPFAGRPAVFVRLWGCGLACTFCDTDFESDRRDFDVAELCGEGAKLAAGITDLVVITGGEPLRQNLRSFVLGLWDKGLCVQIETAGYTSPIDLGDRDDGTDSSDLCYVCSPKTPTLSPQIIPRIDAYKYIVRVGEVSDEDGLPNRSTQVEGRNALIARPPKNFNRDQIYIQPCDDGDEKKNRANTMLARDICLKFGYRLSIQLHKIADVP